MKKNHVWQLVVASLAIIALLAAVSVNVFAAGAQPHFTFAADKTTVNVGETFTVTMGIKECQLASFGFGISQFDTEYLSVESILTPKGKTAIKITDKGWAAPGVPETDDEEWSSVTLTSPDVAAANSKGTCGFSFTSATEEPLVGMDIVVVTFKVKKAGETTVYIYEDSSGADGYKQDTKNGDAGALKPIVIKQAAATTTTKAPTTTTKAPTTTTKAPSTTTKAPETTTTKAEVSTTTKAEVSTTTAAEEPSTTAAEEEPTTTAGDVKTGDNLTVLWIALAVAAVAVVVLAVVSSKKKAR